MSGDAKQPKWVLEDAVLFIRAMQPFAWRCGYHLSLSGGVLNTGRSVNDLDILATPLGKGPAEDEFALRRSFTLLDVHLEKHEQLYEDPVWRGRYCGKMIELHITQRPMATRLMHWVKTRLGWKQEEMPPFEQMYADRLGDNGGDVH